MIASEHSHFGAPPPKKKHHHHGGGRGWGRWGGYYPYYPYPTSYVYEEPLRNRYVILDPQGRAIAIVSEIQNLPPGYTFRAASIAEAAAGLPTAIPTAKMMGQDEDMSGVF